MATTARIVAQAGLKQASAEPSDRPEQSHGIAATIRSIALVNPLADYGISGYTYEFAEGVAGAGYSVDVYADRAGSLGDLPPGHAHAYYPVLGADLRKPAPPIVRPADAQVPGSNAPAADEISRGLYYKLRRPLRAAFLSSQFALHLRRKQYDLVWTQWYCPEALDINFWRLCNLFGIPVVHTVHNVLPHEASETDGTIYRRIYESCRLLVVHSEASKLELDAQFPGSGHKTLVMPHGLYSKIYMRKRDARQKVRGQLGIPEHAKVLLFCGAIRPYKNVDAAIEAIAALGLKDVFLLVAGKEAHYGGTGNSDALSRTRQIVGSFNLDAQVRLIPRMLTTTEMAECLEASDVLLLPYLKSYGSGLMLLGMTFGKHIVMTDFGGVQEYSKQYDGFTIVRTPRPADVAAGIKEALHRIGSQPPPAGPVASDLRWTSIASRIMPEIEAAMGPRERARAASC